VHYFGRFLGALVFLSAFAASASEAPLERARCGGDGPQPFFELSDLQPKSKVLHTRGNVREFLYWETRNALVYRNDYRELRAHYFQDKVDKYFSPMSLPLARVTDPGEQFLLTDRANWFFYRGNWKAFRSEAKHPRHLFWDRTLFDSWLYSLDNVKNAAGRQELRIFRYRAGAQSAKLDCVLLAHPGEELKEAEGARYPFVPLYTVKAVSGGEKLSLWHLDVRSCALVHMGTYPDPVPGRVQAVHRFESIGSYAIKVDHPTLNLLWDYGTGCRFHDIGNGELLVPNHSRPLIGSWDSTDGLWLMNLNHRKKGNFFPAGKHKALRQADLWLPERGSILFASPETEGEGEKTIVQLNIGEVLP
jgi:hypothetical protein